MSRAKIIETAASQLGVSEKPPGSNKTPYGAWYGFDGYAWCAMFVSWVYDKAGHPLGKIDDAKGYRDCNTAYRYWKANNELTQNPEPGDIVLFDWNADGFNEHTGIFHEWADASKKTFWSYEGNTAVSNDSDGGSVMRRKRNLSTVRTFVKPKAIAVAAALPEKNRPELKKGDVGTDVLALQKKLNTLGYKAGADGDFGTTTETAVKAFQKANGLSEDGVARAMVMAFIDAALPK